MDLEAQEKDLKQRLHHFALHGVVGSDEETALLVEFVSNTRYVSIFTRRPSLASSRLISSMWPMMPNIQRPGTLAMSVPWLSRRYRGPNLFPGTMCCLYFWTAHRHSLRRRHGKGRSCLK